MQLLNLVSETESRRSSREQHCPTRKLSAAGEEGLDVIVVEAIVLQHPVEILKILNMALERHLLLPAACSVHTHIFRRHREHSTALLLLLAV